jgi:hypothetical protein
MRGGASGSALASSTVPFDSGRHCAAEAEKPEKRCSGSPGLSTESGMTLKSTSARPPLACSVATRPPTWPAPTVSGPRWRNSHCAPICARRSGLRTSSLSERLAFSLTMTRAW